MKQINHFYKNISEDIPVRPHHEYEWETGGTFHLFLCSQLNGDVVIMLRTEWRCQLPPRKEPLVSTGYIKVYALLCINIFFHCFLKLLNMG
jgi:hypothetical protein